MFTDTHCHIFTNYYDDIDKIIEDAKNKGITKFIVNGCDDTSNKEVLVLSNSYKEIYPALGIHPDAVDTYRDIDIKFIEENIMKIIAIGEIGLDYHYDNPNKDGQLKLLDRQLALADKYHLPVIIHSRDATNDTIKSLKKYPNLKGSIHCFTGSLETANIYIKMGYKLGFGGVTTFKNSKVKNVLKEIPSHSILLETDSPYLSPEPVRGSQNNPSNIYYIASFIARVLGISLDELSNITENSVHELFDI